jgi:hypothetical protein
VEALHDHVGRSVVGLAVVEDAHDAGVADAHGGLGLGAEASHRVGVAREVGVEHLHGHLGAADGEVLGDPDGAHAALAEGVDEPVFPADDVAPSEHLRGRP